MEFLRVLCFKFRAKSSRWGHPSGSSLSQSSIGTKSLPPPSWCLVRVFAMGSPCRVEVVPDLDRNEDFLRPFPSGWCLAFAMGSPILGRMALFCTLDRNEGFFHSSILSCFAMGSPCQVWIFDLISNEGIATVGLLGAVRPCLRVSLCHPLVGRSAL